MKHRAGVRSNSVGSVRRGLGASNCPRLSLFLPHEHGLENPPRTASSMDNILQMMEVAWRQISAARGSTVKLANPEHNLLVSLESARDFMLGMLTEPDPGRRHLEEVFGGDCSRIAQVRAILDAVKLSSRIVGDDRVISCMNAVKSVESVLKKDCGAAARLSEAQRKELKRIHDKQSRFEARHLRGEFSPLKSSTARQSFLLSATGRGEEIVPAVSGNFSRPRSASTSAIGGDDDNENWKALRDTWESGSLFHTRVEALKEPQRSENADVNGCRSRSSSSSEDSAIEAELGKEEMGKVQVDTREPEESLQVAFAASFVSAPKDSAIEAELGKEEMEKVQVDTREPEESLQVAFAASFVSAPKDSAIEAELGKEEMEKVQVDTREPEESLQASEALEKNSPEVDDQQAGYKDPNPPGSREDERFASEQIFDPEQPAGEDSDSDSDVPMPENWGVQRQKRGSIIRPVELPQHLLEAAKLAGYGAGLLDVVEFQVACHEEKIGIAFKILPPAGHLVVERITPGSPAEALMLPKGRLLCVNGVHTGSIEAKEFFGLMEQRPSSSSSCVPV
ncbi:Uncharacterized protein SCF082_LOCUS20538 [Durusdinium trenchii]|uniref:PDZ domain-containing protein n=1 Tax=Durusdinium trenchii TaxID=1381693 RepID=A0ABP0L317_9DINO